MTRSPAAALTVAGASEKAFAFGNGVPGLAAGGFQPAGFGPKAGHPF